MVENFVEKYIPIRIQSTISEALTAILPYKERLKQAAYDKKKFAELHQIILEDDGIPKLVEQLKQIRMNIDDKSIIRLKRTKQSPGKGDSVNLGDGNNESENRSQSPDAVERQDSKLSKVKDAVVLNRRHTMQPQNVSEVRKASKIQSNAKVIETEIDDRAESETDRAQQEK